MCLEMDIARGKDELKGFKYRTVGLAADLMQELGMKVTQLPGGEIIPAMERGVLDAFEFNNPTSDRRLGAQDVCKNYSLGSFHQAMEEVGGDFYWKSYKAVTKDNYILTLFRIMGVAKGKRLYE